MENMFDFPQNNIQREFEKNLAHSVVPQEKIDEWARTCKRLQKIAIENPVEGNKINLLLFEDSLFNESGILKKENSKFSYYFHEGKEIGFFNKLTGFAYPKN